LETIVGPLEQQNVTVTTVEVRPLSLPILQLLLANTLKTDKDECNALSEVVMKKTGGNILFINEFMRGLIQKGHLVSSSIFLSN
jgi:predicted ATPase